MQWARANRQLIIQRFMNCLLSSEEESNSENSQGKVILDIFHNNVMKKEFYDEKEKKIKQLWLHRKGAAPANSSQPVVIPGSRGAFSYLVQPVNDESKMVCFSRKRLNFQKPF